MFSTARGLWQWGKCFTWIFLFLFLFIFFWPVPVLELDTTCCLLREVRTIVPALLFSFFKKYFIISFYCVVLLSGEAWREEIKNTENQDAGASVVAQWVKAWFGTVKSISEYQFQSWLHSFQSSFLLCFWKSSRWWPRGLGSCHLLGRPGWSSWFLVLVWPSPGCCWHLRSELVVGSYLLPLITLSFW